MLKPHNKSKTHNGKWTPPEVRGKGKTVPLNAIKTYSVEKQSQEFLNLALWRSKLSALICVFRVTSIYWIVGWGGGHISMDFWRKQKSCEPLEIRPWFISHQGGNLVTTLTMLSYLQTPLWAGLKFQQYQKRELDIFNTAVILHTCCYISVF
jgi:hypothetical protein